MQGSLVKYQYFLFTKMHRHEKEGSVNKEQNYWWSLMKKYA